MSGSDGGGPAGPKPGSDPAMDDILASIRRILNEDDVPGGGGASEPPPASPPAEAPPAEPLELTESMLVNPPPVAPAATPQPPAARQDQPEPTMPTEAVPRPEPRSKPEAAAEAPPQGGLVAPAVAAATTAALGQLLRTVAAERAAPVLRRGGPSIEDVVREEIRPLLKEWLDEHLPPIVERLVRAEIERVVGRTL